MTFDDPTVRLALLAVATGVLAGALGSWVVLRRQAFLAHASGATAFAGASVAGALSIAVLPVALASSALVAVLTGRLAVRRPETAQVATGLALACGLAVGVIATRTGAPQTGTSVLLGSTLLATDADILTALGVAALAVVLAVLLGRWWLARAIHPTGTATSGAFAGAGWVARNADLALLLMIGVASAALLPVAGALLAGTLLVVPAATAQRLAPHPRKLVPLAGALATAEMLVALLIADATDLSPGATAALVAAGVDVAVAVGLVAVRRGATRTQVTVA
ncbi:MAG: metal ABC transporter permease [Solirubrobacteraceae bacterium]|nr:metal ABC transporter permease [Solirubrobacteraceae bacterium]